MFGSSCSISLGLPADLSFLVFPLSTETRPCLLCPVKWHPLPRQTIYLQRKSLLWPNVTNLSYQWFCQRKQKGDRKVYFVHCLPYPSNGPCCAFAFLFQSRSSACTEIYSLLYLPRLYTNIHYENYTMDTNHSKGNRTNMFLLQVNRGWTRKNFSEGGSREYDISLHEA